MAVLVFGVTAPVLGSVIHGLAAPEAMLPRVCVADVNGLFGPDNVLIAFAATVFPKVGALADAVLAALSTFCWAVLYQSGNVVVDEPLVWPKLVKADMII
jgi:hypothetical protein